MFEYYIVYYLLLWNRMETKDDPLATSSLAVTGKNRSTSRPIVQYLLLTKPASKLILKSSNIEAETLNKLSDNEVLETENDFNTTTNKASTETSSSSAEPYNLQEILYIKEDIVLSDLEIDDDSLDTEQSKNEGEELIDVLDSDDVTIIPPEDESNQRDSKIKLETVLYYCCKKCNTKKSKNYRERLTYCSECLGPIEYECATCHKEYKAFKSAYVHAKYECKAEHMYRCMMCSYRSIRKSNVRRHVNIMHQDSGKLKTSQCQKCGKKYKYLQDLRKHENKCKVNLFVLK